MEKFQPVLLGSDFNAYGMARAFYEEYGKKSIIYASAELAPIKYSKIMEKRIVDKFNTSEIFIKTLSEFAKTLDQNVKYLLITCGDVYSDLVSEHREELAKWFVFPKLDLKLAEKLVDKINFYEICKKYELPHPKTKIIDKEMVENSDEITVPFEYPVALKAANSIEWLGISFEGRKKAYIINSQKELNETLKKIYAAGYASKMICQDFIPGDDTKMRVLNAYVDQNHKVRMMCLGHILLEEKKPDMIGNYLAIMPDYNEKLYKQIQAFLEEIEYVGVANFDLKYDERDGEYKLFEINLRQGRSSFYCTLGGYNLAKYFVEDYIENKPYEGTEYGEVDKLWLGCPISVVKKYAKEGPTKTKALEFIKEGKYGSTAFYDKDSWRHTLLMKYAFARYSSFAKNYYK